MAYFAAVFTVSDDAWLGVDVDLDDVDSLDEVVDAARSTVDDPEVAVVLIRDDSWFAVVRADTDEPAMVFVSDARAASRSGLGELILQPWSLPVDVEHRPVGDDALLADLGLDPAELRALAGSRADPDKSLTNIAEAIGCDEEWEALR